jgi:hypothetical protein
MFRKLLPIAMLALVTACSNTQANSQSGKEMKMACCEKCECCKDGMCKMCKGKMEGMSSMKEGEQCPMCAKMKQGKSTSPAVKQPAPATDHSAHH